ncbi:amidohydrolase [Alteromonas sp. 76-1]|uniref:amidohydrolase n=1 Tax=Alteromonas sp. 76-1 TaxID=2358187 RepID=UPI00101B8A4C|nr:amidohydrolase [Alteromonas sp. 76-1]
MQLNSLLIFVISMLVASSIYAEPDAPYPANYQPLPSTSVAIVGATIMPADGEEFINGTLIIRDGKIAEMGQDVPIPSGMDVINAQGKWVTPGIIDMHSHIGAFSSPSIPSMRNGNEKTEKNTAEVWVEHSIWPQDPAFQRAREGGVTTMNILPGSANLFNGRSVVVKNIPAVRVQDMKVPNAVKGAKLACGENPINYAARGKDPFTRMGNMKGFRNAFIDAQSYLKKKQSGEIKQDLELETISGILTGEITTHIHCYRADEMATMIELSHEFGFKIGTFHHATQAYKIADLLAQEGIAVATWSDRWGFKMEAYDAVPLNAASLEWAGVQTIIHSDSSILAQTLNVEAAKAMAQAKRAEKNISRAQALKWVTLNPAETLGIADRTGSLTKGKSADIVIWSDDPFSIFAKADIVMIDGVIVVDRSAPVSETSDFLVGQSMEELENE